MLILFLAPPSRFFAAWVPPVPDERPAVLVAVLVAAFVGVLWFPALSLAHRTRLLDRVLGLDALPALRVRTGWNLWSRPRNHPSGSSSGAGTPERGIPVV